jgi:hypothetical protein
VCVRTTVPGTSTGTPLAARRSSAAGDRDDQAALGDVGGDGLEVTCVAEHARRPLPDLRAVWGALAPLFP